MRNFTVAFMLVILLSSLMFVILRPIQPAQVNYGKKEKSNVEKLLTEPSEAPQKAIPEMNSTEKKETVEQILQSFEKPNKQFEEEIKNENIEKQPDNNVATAQQPQLNTNNAQNANQFKSLQEELTKKYGNNPNAEVSPEDVQNILMKLLNTNQ